MTFEQNFRKAEFDKFRTFKLKAPLYLTSSNQLFQLVEAIPDYSKVFTEEAWFKIRYKFTYESKILEKLLPISTILRCLRVSFEARKEFPEFFI